MQKKVIFYQPPCPVFKILNRRYIMKITAFICVGILTSAQLLFADPALSQNYEKTVISLDYTNAHYKTVFHAIEKKANVVIMFEYTETLKKARTSIFAKNRTVAEILDQLLSPRNIKWTIRGNVIMLYQAKQSNSKLTTIFDPTPSFPMKMIPDKEITGRVIDSVTNAPLPGVTIQIKGTTKGTTTDESGNFSLSLPNNATLIISDLGYDTKEITVGKEKKINISLAPATTGLNQVVVVGYGTTKKKDLTGSVAQIDNKNLQTVPVYNIGEALEGRASGVNVINNSGQPGSRIQIRIRGGNSMIGSNDPLYVVDGFPLTGGINFLNPADIESIDILKDASATAIYGARGANGVVIITTKRGRKGEKNAISINSYYGVQQVAKKYHVLDAKQYATVVNEWMKNGGEQPFFNVDEIKNPGTNWQDAIFRTAPIQNHTLTFSGSSEKTNYSLSGNYFKQDGIIINSGVQKGSFRLNLDHEIKNWLDLAVNLNLSRRENNSVPVDNGTYGNTILTGALSAPPTLPIYDDNGLPTQFDQIYSFTAESQRNPMIWKSPYKNQSKANTALLNSALNFKLTKELSFKTRVGLEYENSSSNSFNPIIFPNDRGGASSSNTYWNSLLNENILTYNKTFHDHQLLNIIGGFTYQTYLAKSSGISVSGFSNNITEDYNLGSAETINPPSSSLSQWKLASWLGRANYSVNDKYYITASIRSDGSSRFGEENKWGFFPSGALAWRISKEPFMQNISFINDLKLRTSYGLTGNTALSPYQSLDRLSSVKYIYGNHTENVGYAPSGISNSQLKWETTNEFDIGFDVSMINNRISLTADYYNKHTHDLLASVPLPPSMGFGSMLRNIGEIENQGIEVSVKADILTKGFKWSSSAQISSNKNRVLKIAGGSDIIASGASTGLPGMNIARVGEPLGAFYGYLEDGLDENGYIKYVDVNKDGVINPSDRIILGNPYPDFYFGYNSTFSYKNFELNLFLQGSYGNDISFRTAFTNLNSFQRGTNQFEDLIGNYWTVENPNPHAKYPKISKESALRPSDRFIENGSYMRVKSLELAYNILPKKVGIPWFTNARIYVKATNLLTFTNYPGLDPEVNTAGNDSQNIESRLQIGIDENGYPNARVIGGGLQLSF